MRFSNSTALIFTLMLWICEGAEPLKSLENCRFEETEWADGDSFPIITKTGEKMTVRLYGADCIEHHVTDESDARRLRAQRRYFGIAEYGDGPKVSIALAKNLGGAATTETARLLKDPFTVHSAFADARGDGKYKRIYAFVTTSNGTDLSAYLVSKGLARAFGVYRERPEGLSAADYKDQLADLELKAAKLGLGAWKHTDWEKLIKERDEQRKEDSELGLATGAKGKFSGPPINANTAARDELMRLPGVGEVTANRIIQGRPYRSLADLDRVEGIGEKTLKKLATSLVF
ncbi:helix-hairpin-helix domain-containing protein [Akkermansiaceae bacterium]|nr:helix-hairpin-helix domain-containing protein [Akkermansiaceae bacterium]MDB4284822.1 helix-hairpin-helix domain-containing protein [bacterium]MDB4374802.1 helix-hairpin-helix domain-containing protein [bacterium]